MEYSFSKSFNELDTDGDKRYILNILTFITQYTKGYDNIDENLKTDYKLNLFDFIIDQKAKRG